MKAIVVYESHWGNTAAIAKAIAEGIGATTQVLSTAEAIPSALAGVGLIVAGAPLLGFSLPTESMVGSLASNQAGAPKAADISHPPMRSWLANLPKGGGRVAGFETAIWWSPGSSAKSIIKLAGQKGYAAAAKGQRFIVQGRYGPLKAGELERAKLWGAELAKSLS